MSDAYACIFPTLNQSKNPNVVKIAPIAKIMRFPSNALFFVKPSKESRTNKHPITIINKDIAWKYAPNSAIGGRRAKPTVIIMAPEKPKFPIADLSVITPAIRSAAPETNMEIDNNHPINSFPLTPTTRRIPKTK